MSFYLSHWAELSSVILLRYFFFAGMAFLIWYVLFRKRLSFKKIQKRFPKWKDYSREVLHSIMSTAVFGAVAALLFRTSFVKYTMIYLDIDLYPRWYYWLSIFMMVCIHDTYFYWTHRLMHHPKLYKLFHLKHHQSTNPSPWAAYSFSFLESVVGACVLFFIVFSFPFHKSALIVFIVLGFVNNVYGHLGYEIYPKGFNKHWFGKWINTSVNHNVHHRYNKGNYGFYFTFWDRVMGTFHYKSDEIYQEVKSRKVQNL